MREIKFRGKRLDNGEWVVGDYTRYSNEKSIIMVDLLEQEDYWVWSETVGQYTGLKDRNGVEIYEGDIVENTTQRVYLGHRFEVSWNGGYACFQLLNGGKSSNVPLIQDFMSYEVVGNIYENPELRKDISL